MEHKDADVTTLKVKQLKALIQAAGLSHADCFEKSDLRARATAAQAKLAAAPAPKPIARTAPGGRGPGEMIWCAGAGTASPLLSSVPVSMLSQRE